MMDGFKWTQMSFILVLVLQLTAGNTPPPLFYNVRAGDDIALACGNMTRDQSNCDSTTWTWATSTTREVELFELGQIVENSGFQSDRLSVTADCSLVIKKVRKEDAGYLECQQFRSSRQRPPDALVYLSVVSMTEQKKKDDQVTLNCSVSVFNDCTQTVSWQFEGEDVEQQQGVSTSNSPCNASLTVPSYHLVYTSRHNSLVCKVSVDDGGQLFPFRLQASAKNPGVAPTKPATNKSPGPTENMKTATTESGMKDSSTTNGFKTEQNSAAKILKWKWVSISVAVMVVIALVVIVVAVVRRKRAAGNRRLRDDDATDPDDGVTYSSVTISENKNRQAQVRSKKDADEGAEVTYSTLKVSSVDPNIR